MGKRIKPPLPEVTVPRNDERVLLAERLHDLHGKIGKLKKLIDNLIKSE